MPARFLLVIVPVTPHPYQSDCFALAARLAALPWSLWLDSGHPLAAGGRYDILLAFPVATLTSWGGRARLDWFDVAKVDTQVDTQVCAQVCAQVSANTSEEGDDPVVLLRRALAALGPTDGPAPFSGGAAGYFSYDLGLRLHGLPAPVEGALPDLALGLYPGALVMDHATGRGWLAWLDTPAGCVWRDRLLAALESPPGPASPFRLLGPLQADPNPAGYRRAFDRVQAYIQAGDCYQVNLARRYAAPCAGDSWGLYGALRRRNPAPYAAWMNLPWGQVLSSSPERFLTLQGGAVETRPIKGTRPRRSDPAEDARQVAELSASVKDRAENLMIVDLLRNDLGRVCRPGSIRVPDMFRVEHYATVHHLVSVVTGELARGQDALDLLVACFPGGSITGAPKRRAMEIIRELEPAARGLYCGSLGYIGVDGALDLNIAIRTLTVADGEVGFWAGGGLVADSRAEEEYRECDDKARALREALMEFISP